MAAAKASASVENSNYKRGEHEDRMVRHLFHHFGPFSRAFLSHFTPHTLCAVFYLVPMLIEG